MSPDLRTSLLVIFLMLLLCVPVSAVATDNASRKSVRHAAGFSAGGLSGNGVTYRRIVGNRFAQATFFGISSNNGDDSYVNTALSFGTYLHRKAASGMLPPLGLKMMAGADWVLERRQSADSTKTTAITNYDKSYYGGGIGLEIGNPGSAGLSLWLATNYVAGFNGITSPEFESFSILPSVGILYGW